MMLHHTSTASLAAAAPRRASAAAAAPGRPLLLRHSHGKLRPGGVVIGQQQQQQQQQQRSRRSTTRTLATEVLEAPQALERATSEAEAGTAAASSGAPPQPINWFKQWYPVAIISDLDARRPTPATLLGVPLVLWRDGAGQWAALEDKCPHRLAPLSEGRIDADGTLMCSYHGWQFNGQGACTRIPQIGDDKAAAVACGSKRSCVAAFPTRTDQGLLWVWPDADSAAEAAAAAPAVIAELDDAAAWEPRTGWFMREVPISMETVVENVADPCHANFTHHKVQGARSNEKGTDIKPLTPPRPAGFKMEQDSGRFKATFEFVAPCFLKYTFPAFGRVMAVYVVPTSKGSSRMITRFVKSRTHHPPRPGLMGVFLKFMEVLEGTPVLEHALMRNKVLDGDNHILHVQERQLLAEAEAAVAGSGAGGAGGPAAAAWQQRYYLPGTSDTGVAAWRSWLARYGSAMPLLPKRVSDLPPLMDRRQSLDRYSQHTAHCPSCQRALRNIELLRPVAWAASAAALVFAAASAACGAPPLSVRVLGAAAASLALALLHRFLTGFARLFVFTDYVHADVA